MMHYRGLSADNRGRKVRRVERVLTAEAVGWDTGLSWAIKGPEPVPPCPYRKRKYRRAWERGFNEGAIK